MTCDTTLRLTALRDGELSPEAAAETERHLAVCPACAEAWSELAAVRALADAWTVDPPDIADRVLRAATGDDQSLLLDEMRRLRAEMQNLRAEVAALRRQLSQRADTLLWTPLTRQEYSRQDYSQMENDPWNSIRS